ncbi:MAG: hypothetical protein ACREBS_07245 [Nitrososphaerales archaeon]
MRKKRRLFTTLLLLIFFVSPLVSSFVMVQSVSAAYPAYAKPGAYAFYSGTGGFIAFMSGVSANISYYVTNVYSNNTMSLLVDGNLSLGTELSTAPTVVSTNLTDSIYDPMVLPALPPQNLTSVEIRFQNISCAFVMNTRLQVPAGTFNSTEFQGKNANGTILDFWFDRATGLALQMVEAASYFQLIQTNIATPLSTQAPIQAETPFIVVFVVGWGAAGLLFYGIIRYYSKKAQGSAPVQEAPKKS